MKKESLTYLFFTILTIVIFYVSIVTKINSNNLSDTIFENSFKLYEKGVTINQREDLDINNFKFTKIKKDNYLINVNESEMKIEVIPKSRTYRTNTTLKIHKEDFDEISNIMNDIIAENVMYNTTFDNLSKLNINEPIIMANEAQITLLSYDKENEIINIIVDYTF